MKRVKIVTHAHSDWSYDGRWSVAKLAQKLSFFGVDILMMTEHSQQFGSNSLAAFNEDCARASNTRIRVIPGIEYSSPNNEIHILTWGLKKYLGEELPVSTILDAVAQDNGIAVFAHPVRRDVWKKFEPEWAERLFAVEEWNRKSDGLAPSFQARKLMEKHDLPGLFSLDFHRGRQFYPLYNTLKMPDNFMSLGDDEIIKMIRSSRLDPYFFGMAMDGSGRLSDRLGNTVSGVMNGLHKGLLRHRKRQIDKSDKGV